MPYLFNFYILIRKKIRRFVINNKFIDNYFGNMLVELDILVRKMSFFEKGLKKKFILHDGLKFYFEEEDRSFISFLITNDEYERETCEAIESILKPGDTFVDLGANIGFYTLIASRIVGENGKVFSFEPTPSTFQTLKKNIKENNFSNIVIAEDNAVSNVSGVAHFKVTEGSEMNSVTNSNDESTISVKKISLDKYFSNIDHNKIDLIKMDIEGQEYNALLGMKKINLNNKSLKIIFEFHRQALKNNNQSGEEIFNLLSSYGFKIFTVLERGEFKFKFPQDFKKLRELSKRFNLNILAEKH